MSPKKGWQNKLGVKIFEEQLKEYN